MKKRRKPSSGIKMSQNVNIKISKSTRKTSKAPNAFSNANRAMPSISLSLQAPQITPPPYVEQYNTLLKAIQDERKALLSSIPPLAPNTTPLTQNLQRNELLNKRQVFSPLTPVTEAFSKSLRDNVSHETYDDPSTNETLTNFPSRVAQNIAPRLQAGRFDIEDVNAYDNSNNDEEVALAQSVVAAPEAQATGRAYSSNPKYAKKQLLYDEYKELVQSAYQQNPELRESYRMGSIKQLSSQEKIRNEIEKVRQLMK